MGPLAGPAAEACAKAIAREHARVAMLYGPAEYSCLHQFTSVPAGNGNGSGQWPVASGQSDGKAPSSGNGNGKGHAFRDAPVTQTCDMLLLPDWVFQFDLWPAGKGLWSIILGCGRGSEGLMAAYGALKGLIARFGRPEEVLVLPFGCDEREEAWAAERLTEMCRRFLDITPRMMGEGHPDLRVQSSQLLPVVGGVDGIKELLESIGKVRLAVINHPKVESAESRPSPHVAHVDTHEAAEAPAPAEQQRAIEACELDESAEVTALVPIAGVPGHGQDVLQALLEHRGAGLDGFFDVWRRSSVAGTITGSEGLVGAVHATGDVLAFALWMCRQAQTGQIDELASITIAVRDPDDWLIEAAQAMPIPVHWLRWHAYQIQDVYGLSFTGV